MAIKAASTGHMVLSTLHTNDAPSTLTRLLNMGVAPFNIAAAVSLITAQRLARRLCPSCKVPMDVPKQALLGLGFNEHDLDGSCTVLKQAAARIAMTATRAASAFIKLCPSAMPSAASL